MCIRVLIGPNRTSPRGVQEMSLSTRKDGGHRIVKSRTLKHLFNLMPKRISLKSLGLFLHLTASIPLYTSLTSDFTVLY